MALMDTYGDVFTRANEIGLKSPDVKRRRRHADDHR